MKKTQPTIPADTPKRDIGKSGSEQAELVDELAFLVSRMYRRNREKASSTPPPDKAEPGPNSTPNSRTPQDASLR